MEGEEEKRGGIRWWMFLIVFLVIAVVFVGYNITSKKIAEEKIIAAKAQTPVNYPFPVYNDSAAQEVKKKLPTCLQDDRKGYTSCTDEEYLNLAIANKNSSLCDRIVYDPIRIACLQQMK